MSIPYIQSNSKSADVDEFRQLATGSSGQLRDLQHEDNVEMLTMPLILTDDITTAANEPTATLLNINAIDLISFDNAVSNLVFSFR